MHSLFLAVREDCRSETGGYEGCFGGRFGSRHHVEHVGDVAGRAADVVRRGCSLKSCRLSGGRRRRVRHGDVVLPDGHIVHRTARAWSASRAGSAGKGETDDERGQNDTHGAPFVGA